MTRRTLMTFSCATALSALLATSAGAQPGPRMHGGPGGPGRMMGIPDLTQEQRDQIQQMMEAQRDERMKQLKMLSDLRRELELAVFAEGGPDTGKIEALKPQIAQAESDALAQHLDMQARIASILTPEQRAKARERASRAPQDFGPRRGRGPGGPGGAQAPPQQ